MKSAIIALLFNILLQFSSFAQEHALALQTGFGLKDGAVSATKGVA